ALMPAFRRLVASNGAILDQLNSLNQGTSQILRIASPASFAALHIAPAFQQVRKHFPDHVLDVSEIDDDVAFNLIRSGDIDFGISSVFVPSPGLSFAPLHQDGACVVVAVENELAQRAAISDEALLSQPIVRFPIGTTSDQWLSIILERNRARPSVVAEVRQLLTGLQMVRLNLGVALMPADAARACLLPGLVIVPLADRTMTRTLGLVRSEAHHPTALEAALLDALPDIQGAQ
ncbi:MAG TPA: LysR family transcriptional regulator substrate-binding protein, partial [Terriglobales bacterium]|nr:LysR family transcriptional regulator substrate-binding protein [Terriglobales bacterium]